MSIRVLSHGDISKLLALQDAQAALELVALMEDTFKAYTVAQQDDSKKRYAQAPMRLAVDTDSHRVLFMPSRLQDTTSIKVVSVPTGDSKGGLPGSILVLDEKTGATDAIMNAGVLTAVRTAAGSAVATRLYAVSDAKHLLVLGAGAQARAHIDMMLAVRPSLQHVAIWNRGSERRQQLVDAIQTSYPHLTVQAVASDNELEAAARQADIVCTCTNASQPVLHGAWLKSTVHLNCVGSYRLDMHEVDADTIKLTQRIIVDSIEACGHEAGELVASSKSSDWIEMGRILLDGTTPSDQDRQCRTLFKSVGISVQDSAIAGLMVKRAKDSNSGSVVPF
ncbi:NAD(P)-binding protein [Lichtheimia hyalospora FSU 10163]|nr:NAD(P)-binding protein [Lichtheimia hyalospora FSU 10163]